jgi:hypothetical protein
MAPIPWVDTKRITLSHRSEFDWLVDTATYLRCRKDGHRHHADRFGRSGSGPTCDLHPQRYCSSH